MHAPVPHEHRLLASLVMPASFRVDLLIYEQLCFPLCRVLPQNIFTSFTERLQVATKLKCVSHPTVTGMDTTQKGKGVTPGVRGHWVFQGSIHHL